MGRSKRRSFAVDPVLYGNGMNLWMDLRENKEGRKVKTKQKPPKIPATILIMREEREGGVYLAQLI